MSDSRDRLIEAAVRPFSDNAEMAATATHFLSELVNAEPEGAEEAITRWDAVDAKSRLGWWRRALFSVLFVSLVVLFVDGAPRVRDTISTFKVISAIGSLGGGSSGPLPQPGRKNLTPEERLILYGDETQSSKSDKAKGVWDRHPESAAYFAQYVQAYHTENRRLPPDFLITARQIDPQNAWFTYLAAGVEADKAVNKKERSKADKAAGKPREWEVLDQNRLDEALKLIREARSQSRFNDYRTDLLRLQIPLMAQDNTVERLSAVSYLAAMTASDLIVMRKLGDVIGTKASQLAKENDTPRFRELMSDVDHLTRHSMHTEPSNLVAGLVHGVNISMTSESLADGAKMLGIHPEAERYQAIYDTIQQGRDNRRKTELLINGVEFIAKSDMIAGLTIPMVHRQVANPPIITDADLKPGRMIEHEQVATYFSFGMIVVLGLGLLGCWAFRYRQGVFSARFSKRLESLVTRADWFAIIGIGVFLPFFLVVSLNRFTPLGGQDLSVTGMKFLLPAAHYTGLLMLMLILPVLIARLRMGKRTGSFSFNWGKSWFGWASVLFLLACVVLTGIAVKSGNSGLMATVAVFSTLPQIWLLATIVRAFLSKPSRVLMSGTIARILMPTYATAMLLMVAWVPVLIAAEAHWFRNDSFNRLDPEYPGMTSYEYKVAVQLQKETLEILGYER